MKTLIGLATMACLAGGAHAATLTATSGLSDPGLSGFTIDFDDTGDGLLQFAEITAFSGISLDNSLFFDSLLVVPDIVGFATAGGPSAGSTTTSWVFGQATGTTLTANATPGVNFSYEITGIAAVPLPASLPLVLMGMGAIGLSSHRRRSRAKAASYPV